MKKKDKKDKFGLCDTDSEVNTPVSEGLSEDEIELLRASRPELDRSTLPNYDNSDMALAKRYIKKNKLKVLFAALTLVLLIAIIAVLSVMLVREIIGAPSKEDYELKIGDQKQALPYKQYTRDGVFYLDLCLLADEAGLVIGGTSDSLTFNCEDGTYVRIEDGRDTATVNGVRVKVNGIAEIIPSTEKSAAECLLPISFIEKLFSHKAESNSVGLKIVFSSKNNKLEAKRLHFAGEHGKEGRALKISFSPDCFEKAEDLELAYLTQNYTLACAYPKLTMLVNKNNPLSPDYIPSGLVSLDTLGCAVRGEGFRLVNSAAQSLCSMLNDLNATLSENEKIYVTSAYRDYAYQKSLFAFYINRLVEQGVSRAEAEATVQKTSAKAGESEHQSGLCVDLIRRIDTELNVAFENTAGFAWLSQNAHRYGFILRYPKGKESTTLYNYEPWHFRYVGIDAATVIYEDGLCLEEYLGKSQ